MVRLPWTDVVKFGVPGKTPGGESIGDRRDPFLGTVKNVLAHSGGASQCFLWYSASLLRPGVWN